MKIAVMADIHGNRAALETVLQDLAGQENGRPSGNTRYRRLAR